MYLSASALPDDAETRGGPFVGISPRASLRLGGTHQLTMAYEADFRQAVKSSESHESTLDHAIAVSYRPPPLLDISFSLMAALSQLYLRDLSSGGWQAGQGGLSASYALATDLLFTLGYLAAYVDYNAGSSLNWEVIHGLSWALTWQIIPDLIVEPEYTFSSVDADSEEHDSRSHNMGLNARWQIGAIPLSIEMSYHFVYSMMDSATIGERPSELPPPPIPGELPPQIRSDRRTDTIHRIEGQLTFEVLPWLDTFLRVESLFGSSNLIEVDDYSRHQFFGGVAFRLPEPSIDRPAYRPVLPQIDRLELEFQSPGVERVSVVGNFNDWDASKNPLEQRSPGRWVLSIELPPGDHQYLLWVDGSMRPPPTCERWIPDGFGEKNCVVVIPD